ncbi:hypothetical protein CDL15_Pgr016597 [Punica granatum]|uniref:Pectinesterase inhibitor domain-containing protein n=1 Tax=Punica granatum TaxID=22663 RepID=A0A218XSV9_PUNGR|nr:hypothetical protein CDL15_Pgr016597 [Punica granatum]
MNPLVFLLLALVTLPALAQADDIDFLCSKTPFPAVYASTLRADPKSKGATTLKLGLIVVAKVESIVKVALKKVKSSQHSAMDPNLKSALTNCASRYHAILIGDVVASRESLTKGDYKFAEEYMTDASIELGLCEEGFPPRQSSPVKRENNSMKQLAEVAAAISRTLL